MVSVSSKGFTNIQAITEFRFNRNAYLIWQKYIVWNIHYDFFFDNSKLLRSKFRSAYNKSLSTTFECPTMADIVICYKESQLPSFYRLDEI